MLEDTIMGSAGSARPADAQSESSEDLGLEPGQRFARSACVVALSCRCNFTLYGTTEVRPVSRNTPLCTGDLTEQEVEAILDDNIGRAVLWQQSGSGEGELDEDSSDDEDYEDDEDGDDEDDDPEEDEEEDDDENDIRRRTLAFFGFGEPTVRKQLAKHPKLSDCQPEQLLHPAAQMLNLSSAAVNAKDCLSVVRALCHTPSRHLEERMQHNTV